LLDNSDHIKVLLNFLSSGIPKIDQLQIFITNAIPVLGFEAALQPPDQVERNEVPGVEHNSTMLSHLVYFLA
jgi:hypothetical protein